MNLEQRVRVLERKLLKEKRSFQRISESENIKNLIKNQIKFLTTLATVSYGGRNYSFDIIDFSNYSLELLFKDDLFIKISKSIKGEFQGNFGRPSGEKKQLISISYQTSEAFNKQGRRFENYSICDPWDLPKKISNLIERYY